MAATGLMLVGFVVGHLLGNTTVFVGADAMNSYAQKLRDLGPLLWLVRGGLLAVVSVHIFFGIQLTLENTGARPESYKSKRHQRASLAGRTMVYTGLLILLFVVYHLLHFTFQVTNPETSAHANLDATGRPDVYLMVTSSFEQISVALIYVVAMLAVLFHLSHGLHSLLQTFGLTTPAALPRLERLSTVIAVVVQVGFILIPVTILLKLIGGAS